MDAHSSRWASRRGRCCRPLIRSRSLSRDDPWPWPATGRAARARARSRSRRTSRRRSPTATWWRRSLPGSHPVRIGSSGRSRTRRNRRAGSSRDAAPSLRCCSRCSSGSRRRGEGVRSSCVARRASASPRSSMRSRMQPAVAMRWCTACTCSISGRRHTSGRGRRWRRCLLGVAAEADDAARSAAVDRAVAAGLLAEGDELLARDLVGITPQDGTASLLSAMDVATRERGRARVLHRLVQGAAERAPLLVVIEDMHWADGVELVAARRSCGGRGDDARAAGLVHAYGWRSDGTGLARPRARMSGDDARPRAAGRRRGTRARCPVRGPATRSG